MAEYGDRLLNMTSRIATAGRSGRCLLCRTAFWWLIVTGFYLALAVGQEKDSSARSFESVKSFRVMTYNIHHGEGVDGRVDLERIADVIKKERVDLVALQEVDKGVARTGRRDFPGELAALTGMTCVFSNNYHYQGGEYGNAILSKFPILTWTNTHLQMIRQGEQRGILQTTVSVAGKQVVFMATHIDYRREDDERIMNVAEFKRIVKRYSGLPVIICGDFNDTPGSRTYANMTEEFVDVWAKVGDGPGYTITSTNPTKRIDYIWLHKEQDSLEPLRASVIKTPASDHLPLVAELQWRDNR